MTQLSSLLFGKPKTPIVMTTEATKHQSQQIMPQKPKQYIALRSPDQPELEKFVRQLYESKIFAFDFETTGFDPHSNELVGISVSFLPHTAVYLPIGHKLSNGSLAPGQIQLNTVLDILEPVFTSSQHIKVIQNIIFEAQWLRKYGIYLRLPVFDTMVAARILKLPHAGLKELSKTILGVEQETYEQVTDGRDCGFDQVDIDRGLSYACADSDYALQLYDHFTKELHQDINPKLGMRAADLESPIATVLGTLKYNGWAVDHRYLEQLGQEYRPKLETSTQKVFDLAGWPFEINSDDQLAAVLFDELGFTCDKYTKKGKRATDKEVLKRIGEQHPIGEALLEQRKYQHIITTYVDGLLRFVNPRTERIHTDLNQFRAEKTMRFSSSEPNLQNIPRKENDPLGIRRAFIAPEGKLLLFCDYSQIELRVGAFKCRDDNMLKIYKEGYAGGDIHDLTTHKVFKIPLDEVKFPDNKRFRTIAKSINFMIFFGGGGYTLKNKLYVEANMDLPLEECEEYVKLFLKEYPGVKAYQDSMIAFAKKNGYVETMFGFRRYLPDIQWRWPRGKKYKDLSPAEQDAFKAMKDAERQAMNTPIQGSAADIMKLAMINMYKGLPEHPWIIPVMQIHDELIFEVPAERVEEAARWVKSVMETPIPGFDIPLIADAKAGPNWADATGLAV